MKIDSNSFKAITETGRILEIKKRIVECKPSICTERAKIVTQAYDMYSAYPNIKKRAYSLRRILKEMSIYIEENQLFVGNQASSLRAAPIFPEYSWNWIVDELDTFTTREYDPFIIDKKEAQELKEILAHWKNKTLRDRAELMQPKEVKEATQIGIMEWEGNVTAGEGHIAIDYPTCLKLGYKGIIDKCQKRLDAMDFSNPEHIRQKDFLESVIIVFKAGISFALRYAKLAASMVNQTNDTRRKHELLVISRMMENVPEQPPSNFYEALQMLWLTHLIVQIEASGHSMSLGRIDQYLYEYFINDIKNGALTYESAIELIDCFYLKLFSINKLRSASHSRVLAGYPTYQNITLAGQKSSGDAVNELSFCFLKSVEHIRLSEPNLYIRYHDGINADFMKEALKVVALGTGIPAFVNDNVCIPSLVMRGVSAQDAIEYSTMGCLEIEVPGKWGYRANGKSKFNIAKVFEMAVFGGKDPRTNKSLKSVKSLKECVGFEEFFNSYAELLNYYIKVQVTADNINDYCMEDMVPDAFCSALVQDCIERGKHIKQGGPIYDFISGAQIGVPDVGNSLASIKEYIFDNKAIDTDNLLNALQNNYKGIEGIRMRNLLLSANKYGNDIDDVDELTNRAFNVYCHNIAKYKNMRLGTGPIGCGWYASTVTLTANIPAGEVVGALPSGRLAGQPLADGISPVHGTEIEGPTAVVKSVSKLSNILVTGGQLLNMRFTPQMLNDKKGIEGVLNLMKVFFELKGWHIQFNVMSTDILRKAQSQPDEYKDLVIRVAGYSALFVALDPKVQEDIISRTQYELN